jgi:hypothetical protein
MFVETVIESANKRNDYLYWGGYHMTTTLSSTLQGCFGLLYNENHLLNKYSYMIQSERTAKETKEELAELDKFS